MTTAHDQMIELGQHKWTTKVGEKLTWADMGLRHLKNTSAMLKRQEGEWSIEADCAASYTGGGDMASMSADHAMDHAFNMLAQIKAYRKRLDTYIGLREAARLTYNGPKPQKVTT